MNRTYRAAPIAALLGLATLLLIPASAAAQADTGSFELYAGYYLSNNDLLKNDLTYGVRGAYRWTNSLASEISAGRYGQSYHFGPDAGLDINLTLLDLSTVWTFNPGSRAEFSLFAGPGWAFVDVTARDPDFPNETLTNDSFTLHVGAKLQINLSDRVYVRPDVRARWFEKGTTDALDFEASLGLGIRIGG